MILLILEKQNNDRYMNKGEKKLELKKIKISKLTNLHLIIGGSELSINQTAEDYTCKYCGTGQTIAQSSQCERDPDGIKLIG